MNTNYTLYLVTKESVPMDELLYIVEEAVKGGVTIVQLREKNSSGKIFYEKALKLKELLHHYQVPLIINDRVDIALAIGADGVHVGQDDLPLHVVRKIVPKSMLVGVSVSTVEEAQIAEQNGANYIGVGSIFSTQTKSDAKLLPRGMLEKIVKSVSIPAVAIGGINLSNVQSIIHTGISGIAIVSSIMESKNPKQTAQSFREVFLANPSKNYFLS